MGKGFFHLDAGRNFDCLPMYMLLGFFNHSCTLTLRRFHGSCSVTVVGGVFVDLIVANVVVVVVAAAATRFFIYKNIRNA